MDGNGCCDFRIADYMKIDGRLKEIDERLKKIELEKKWKGLNRDLKK